MPLSGSQNQFVQLRQTQLVDPTAMIDFKLTHLTEQILALDASDRGAIGGSAWLVAALNAVFVQLVHYNLLLNANNSYLDYLSFEGRMQVLFNWKN
jgi:hypothetical protein